MKQNFLVTSYIVNAYISENNRNWTSLLKIIFFKFTCSILVRCIMLLFLLMKKKLHYFGEVYFVTFPSYVNKYVQLSTNVCLKNI